MKTIRVVPRAGGRPLEQHDITHRRPHEVERLRAVLELAYHDRDAVVEEASAAAAGQAVRP
jgi:hypothetical protein